MIVPMKKVSLIVSGSHKKTALKKLRTLGLVHIELSEDSLHRSGSLADELTLLEESIYVLSEKSAGDILQRDADAQYCMNIAASVASAAEKQQGYKAEISACMDELKRLDGWGEVSPEEIQSLAAQGIELSLYEMPRDQYDSLSISQNVITLAKTKSTVRFVLIGGIPAEDENSAILRGCAVTLPARSTSRIKQEIEVLEQKLAKSQRKLSLYRAYLESMKKAVVILQKELEFENCISSMTEEFLTDASKSEADIAYISGYIPSEDLAGLRAAAAENSWGLVWDDPTAEDNVPTKLKNNRFVSLIYPLTDFLGTVPGYFEYDISAWFLGFILIFFGIIFGDGGYGLLICGASLALIAGSVLKKQKLPAAYLLLALFGIATILWGTLTCTWFGMDADMLPSWLKALSIPVISNVYADKIWYPFWTNGEAGLTTAQNVQILCFSLALIQLTVAHVMGTIRNRRSLKALGDIGSIMQLIGIYYVVLALVVNGQVFAMGLVLAGIPVGTAAFAFIGVGFVMSFVFANYDGSLKESVLSSLTNIVSVLLGVVNLFSDIVSYIRLWAVGLAGAAISATVNELAGPFFGNLAFVIIAVVLLIFGHGLNMILNVLSVIVHGIRLNTLEFSSHLDMSWSGHKFKPFEE